jgi:hypothetical protein
MCLGFSEQFYTQQSFAKDESKVAVKYRRQSVILWFVLGRHNYLGVN